MTAPPSSAATLVRVDPGPRSYDIEVDAGNLARLGAFLESRDRATHAVVVTDGNVDRWYGSQVVESLRTGGRRVDQLTLEPGEERKSVASAEWLWNRCAELNVDRKTVVVALGGGVIGGLAGFVAATYARGLRFFQIPTTLLAQVDSSVGGKVGVNLPAAKNMVGAFWQPRGVLIDTTTLATLPEREYLSGLAEVVKYGVIQDADFFSLLERSVEGLLAREPSLLAQVVARCCRLKADVVERDEREETGLRAILNYGHTFAHAFEAVSSYGTLLHGEAVSIGMMCAARLAVRLGRVPEAFVQRQERLLVALRLPIQSPNLNPQDLLAAMRRDKKVEHGRLRFVLPIRMGQVELVERVAEEQALRAL